MVAGTPILKRLVTSHLWLSLLLLIHLPYVGIYCQRLWNLDHYQFFPFSFVAFGTLFYQRCLSTSFRWTPFCTMLVAADLVLLCGGFYWYSPLLVYLGAVLLFWAICHAVSDSQFAGSLGYLILLLLITVRLPQNLDLDAIHWLQRTTTGVGSRLLNFFGFLHLRMGNVLEFPGKRFLVEEACSGVQSLFTVLFLATVIAVGYRRKLFHTLLVLASAAIFAGVMNVLRVTVISVAWSSYQYDLSVGWQHDAIGHLALIVAAGLVYSADATIQFFCSPVPDIPGGGMSAVFWNPLTSLWNWLFLVRPRSASSDDTSSVTDAVASGRRDPSGYHESPEERDHAGFRDFLRPRNIFQWAWSFIESWFLSREYARLIVGVPFLLVGVGGVFFVSWLRSAPSDVLVKRYQVAVEEALQQDDPTAAGLYLRGLVELRPLNQQHRFRLALHQLQQGEVAAAVPHLTRLTAENGYTPARMWLVTQAQQADPQIPLDSQQMEQQLRAVIDQKPQHGPAHQLLAELSLQKGQLKQAEDHLLQAVEGNPNLSLALARVQRMLNRDDQQVSARLDTAEALVEAKLLKNPGDAQARVTRAEVLVMRDQFTEAERLLKEGLAGGGQPRVRQALAALYARLAGDRIRVSLLNRELAQKLVTQAIQLDPENEGYARQALALTTLGARYSPADLQPSIDVLTAAEQPSVDQRVLLAQMQALIGEAQAAVDQIAPLLAEHSRLRPLQVKFLKLAGHTAEADTMIRLLLTESEERNEFSTLKNVCDHVELLLAASRFQEALTMLQAAPEAAVAADKQANRRSVLISRACIELYDQSAQSRQLSEDSLLLLDQAVAASSVSLGIIERLVRLSCSDSDLSQAADGRLTRILANGDATAGVYNLVGTSALGSDDLPKAKRYLERAYSLNQQDPMVLNNLAVALVRGADESSVAADSKRALTLIDTALTILPQQPDVLSTRGEVLIAQERWEDARRDLEVALSQRQKSANIRRLLVQVFEALEEPALAAEHARLLKQLMDEDG